jgi:hypothetical protein
MSEAEAKKINYIIVCVNEFAESTGLGVQEAFRYLYNYKGIEFINEHYDIEHTLSLEDAVDDLKKICFNNGGKIACKADNTALRLVLLITQLPSSFVCRSIELS